MPDVLRGVLSRNRYQREVRQQVQPPAFSPERNDENLSGVFVAEAKMMRQSRPMVMMNPAMAGHAGIATLIEDGLLVTTLAPDHGDQPLELHKMTFVSERHIRE